jgi:hypothetical protein
VQALDYEQMLEQVPMFAFLVAFRILDVSGNQANFMTSATYLILITASKVDA